MKHRIASRGLHHIRPTDQLRVIRRSEVAARLRILGGTAVAALVVVAALSSPVRGSPTGEATEDIIGGCNQFIKVARKGRWRQDPDSMRQLGECVGAVRTMLATEIAAETICPTENTKLIDAVTAFSLYIIQNPAEMRTVYVVPLRQALRAAYPCSAIRQ
jgi:hypothetical protein